MRVVLASGSPRRRELLLAAGIEHEVVPADIDESRLEGESAPAYVERLARRKAAVVAERHPVPALVVGADTVVAIDGEILGKPKDRADAVRMLGRLSGRSHEVMTGIAVAVGGGDLASAVARTMVWFARLPEEEIARYVAAGESDDKAGAYAIQGRASRFIPRIDGSYTNVVGLPIAVLMPMLVRAGWREVDPVGGRPYSDG